MKWNFKDIQCNFIGLPITHLLGIVVAQNIIRKLTNCGI